jgi:hypothetical protein
MTETDSNKTDVNAIAMARCLARRSKRMMRQWALGALEASSRLLAKQCVRAKDRYRISIPGEAKVLASLRRRQEPSIAAQKEVTTPRVVRTMLRSLCKSATTKISESYTVTRANN